MDNIIPEDLKNFTHPALNEPITAIGGSYYYTAEFRREFEEDDLLYYVGAMVVDTSCCGTGGCAYAMVAGFVREWKYGTDDNGRPVSRVRPVTQKAGRERIAAFIRKKHTVQQVSFVE
ncbi:MAG: hypothetical protein GXP53_12790 [Deltaproteobacteria bacterium]|nr:hypothetical protein [Deltaproteobacteria bacterium]